MATPLTKMVKDLDSARARGFGPDPACLMTLGELKQVLEQLTNRVPVTVRKTYDNGEVVGIEVKFGFTVDRDELF